MWLCSRKCQRTKHYEERVKIIHQRMDAQSIMINNGNVHFLSAAVFRQYQKAIIAEADRSLHTVEKKLETVDVGKALEELATNLSSPPEDPIHAKIDTLLAQMVQNSQSIQRSIKEQQELSLAHPSHSLQSKLVPGGQDNSTSNLVFRGER